MKHYDLNLYPRQHKHLQSTTMLFAIAILFTIMFSACSGSATDEPAQPKIPFEKSKWAAKEGDKYPYRKLMVNDILNSYKWAGLKKDSVIRMLGQPDNLEEGNLMYTYDQEPFLGGLGTSIETIVFELAPDSTVKRARFNDGGWD